MKQTVRGLGTQFLQELLPSKLLPSLTVGFVNGVIGICLGISFAALIFSGELNRYISAGVGIVLFSSAVIRAVTACLSSFPPIIADIDPLPSAILALMATAIANRMPASATAEEIFLTIVLAIALTSVLTGAFLLTLGLFKVGDLIRYIPYPVVGGFLAGTGWLLVQGAIQVMTDVPLGWEQLPFLLRGDVLFRWLPGLIFAVVLLVISRRYTHFSVMPASLLTATGLFYGWLLLTNTSAAQAMTQGWLLGPFPQASLWQPLTFSDLMQVNWSVVFNQLSSMTTIMVISAPAILLAASGLELMAQQDIDLNRELLAVGIANLICGLGGGMVGYHGLPDSVLVYKMGGRSRVVGLSTAVLFTAVLIFGASVFSYSPKLVLGGLLLFQGLSFLVESIYDDWFKLPKTEYFVVLLILVVIGTVGFLEGVGVGLIAAVILFVINYSQNSVTKHALSGVDYSSRVQRPFNQERLLRQKGEQVYILELQGSIFFGTANKLLNQIRQRFNDSTKEPLRFVVLDFRWVCGLDSSAVLSFVKLKQLAVKQQISLVLTNLPPALEKQLRQGGALDAEDAIAPKGQRGAISKVLPDLDRGVEWCENQILEARKWRRQRFLPLAMQLKNLFTNGKEVSTFIKYLEKVQLGEGEYLFRQGEDFEFLYFVESGQVSTFIELDGGQTRRLQTLGAGTIVGEIAFYTKSGHQTCAIAEQPSKLYRLGVNKLHLMQQENPKAAAAFNEFVLSLLAERLSQAHKEIENLLK